MITGIAIENFKGIADRVELDLRPITLLFGPNSAGKSTITDALDFLEAVLEARSASIERLLAADRTSGRRELSFSHLLHNHDLSRRMTLGVSCELSDADEEHFMVHGQSDDEQIEGWGAPTAWPANINCDQAKFKLEISMRHLHAHFEGGPVDSAVINQFKIDYEGEPLIEVSETSKASGRLRGFRWIANLSNPIMPDDLGQQGMIEFVNFDFSLLPRGNDPPLTDGLYKADQDHQQIPNAAIAVHLNTLVLGTFAIAVDRLRRRRTIAGIREVPNRRYLPVISDFGARWHGGLAAWDYLAYCGDDALAEINYWLSQERLAAGYHVAQKKLVNLSDALRFVRPPGAAPQGNPAYDLLRLQSSSERRAGFVPYAEGTEFPPPFLYPSDVGTGLSQIVPVIVAALHPTACLNSIAQPDLHLHPRLQAELGDLFLHAINRESPNHFLLETHSEHLILRLLRRVRETAKSAAPEGCSIRTNDLGVYFVQQSNGTTTVRKIDVDVRGEFIQPWPDDFFELDFYERFPNAE